MKTLPERSPTSSHITPKSKPKKFAPAFLGRTPKLLLASVPLSALKVYIFLSDETFDGWAQPYRSKMLENTGLSKSGVRSGIEWLICNGWILRQRHYYGYNCPRYMILDSPIPTTERHPVTIEGAS